MDKWILVIGVWLLWMDNICIGELIYDMIDIGGGGGIFIGGKATPYGVVTTIIFVYERGGGCVGIMDIYDWGLVIII